MWNLRLFFKTQQLFFLIFLIFNDSKTLTIQNYFIIYFGNKYEEKMQKIVSRTANNTFQMPFVKIELIVLTLLSLYFKCVVDDFQ